MSLTPEEKRKIEEAARSHVTGETPPGSLAPEEKQRIVEEELLRAKVRRGQEIKFKSQDQEKDSIILVIIVLVIGLIVAWYYRASIWEWIINFE